VHVTRDGGKNWERVTPPDLPDFTRISLIEASPHDAATAYVAANRYQKSDRAPYVYRTHDFGRTWTKIVEGIRSDDFARAIEEDPKRKGLLFLGTETGIYVSFDEGAMWQDFRRDLPVTPVHGVTVKNDDLVIATHGRSFYVMDNINVLRQIAQTTTDEAVVLFKPGDAMRSVSRGVAIDYYLKQPAESVTIEIADADGHVIKTFTGTPPDPAKKDAPAAAPDEGFRPPPPAVKVAQGLNRFVWDTRYPDARDFKGLIMWAGSVRGPAAPPGTYQVRLTAAGVTKTQSFAIVRNPHIAATDADLHEQFALAKQINDKVSAANEAVIRIRDVKDQIGDRVTKANDTRVKSAGDALDAKLTGVEGEIYQYQNRSGQDPLNFPIRLNNKLAALQGLVEAGDAKPTDQSYVVFRQLADQLDRAFRKLDGIVKDDLETFNQQIAKKKLAPVVPPK
jgi:photosystem II stability/assembly factor-like uncharacterized protein